MPIVATYTRTDRPPKDQGYSRKASNLYSTRQKLPFVSGPYRSVRYSEGRRVPPGMLSAVDGVTSYLENSDANFGLYHVQRSTQTARSRLNNSLIKGRAALGITAATANRSFSMVATRGSQLLNAYRALRKGNVRKMERSLGILRNSDGTINHGSLKFTKNRLPPSVRKHFNAQVRKVRVKPLKWKKGSIENMWLEYTFGWVPLVADVQEVLKVRSDPFEVSRSHGTAALRDIVRQSDPYANRLYEFRTRTVCTAGIRITNPNVALLTQLGLNNPLAVAWDIIPFSFVVDWFFKISTYLNTYNDLAGFAYVDPVTTVTKRATGFLEDKRSWQNTVTSGRKRERTLMIVNKPKTPYFQLPTPSLWLAATSFSLLSQQMRRRK